MTEITDLSPTDSSNTSVTGESLDGSIANMGRMDNTLQAVMGMLARSIRSNIMRWIDGTDSTKRVALDLSGLPTATTRTLGVPYYSGTLGLVSDIRGQIYGLTLSNNVTDATNDIDIAAGAAVDNGGAVSMVLASGLTKQLDAVWDVGNNAGMRASGAAIADGTYHIFLIRRPDTGVVDIAADTSVTGANIAANTNAAYTQIRRIFSIIRASGAILRFFQLGDDVLWLTSKDNTNFINSGTVAFSPTFTVPAGISVNMKFNAIVRGGASPMNVLFSSPYQTDVAPTGISDYSISGPNTTSGVLASGQFTVRTDTSAQMRIRADFSDANSFIRIATMGYTDSRGQLS